MFADAQPNGVKMHHGVYAQVSQRVEVRPIPAMARDRTLVHWELGRPHCRASTPPLMWR